MARRSRSAGPPPANPRAFIEDWLNLVEPDGAFLTTAKLLEAFPSGFEPMDAAHRTELRSRAADIDADPNARVELRHWLLGTVLGWDDLLAEDQRIPVTATVRAAEHGAQLRPDAALLDVGDHNRVRVGVFAWPYGTRLDRRTDPAVAGDSWPASPIQRAETWCRESGTPLALVTDDDQWVLVWAPRGAPAASCRWRITDLADERILQAGLVSLLGAGRFFRVAETETLERLFEKAAEAEAEITKGLGLSVRRSVELLVAAISRDDVAEGGAVLDGIPDTEVYEAAVSVLMRLVFLLFAEERRLLPAEDPLWAESYSVLTLRDDLRNAAIRDGDDALERRTTAWHRLLATFRAVHGGARHDRLTLPAYGGSLFDPDRFPFLEGRRRPDHLVVDGVDLGPANDAATGPGRPVAIDDRTVLAILDSLLNIQVKVSRNTVTQRVSYKALDVEQIGHCYEGLLDHGCAPVDVLSLGLVGPNGAEPELTVDELEAHLTDGPAALCEWLSDKSRCKRTASALQKLLERQPEGIHLARLRVACGHDDDTVARVLPFWGLIREDLRGLPVVLLPGSKYVTQTSTRRNTGAQYTTKALAEEVARYALEPLVYDPGPQNEADPEKWRLRTPGEILDLRVCDPAVGSGAILTAAGRYLADRLIESLAEHGPGDGRFASRLADIAAAPAEEQTVLARREIVDHCLYGVDKNPVAAEMAKLSLWLTTMARERPFTFLDHAIQAGDSLLGITDIEQLRWLHLDPSQRKGQAGFETLALDHRIKEAADLAQRLQEMSVVTVRDAAEKQRLHNELRAKLADLSIVADTVVGAALSAVGKSRVSAEQRLDAVVDRIRVALDQDLSPIEQAAALNTLQGLASGWLRTDLPDVTPSPWERRPLHWPLAFPEVFFGPGNRCFHVVVANPPFLGGVGLTKAFGQSYRAYLARHVAPGRRAAQVDLLAFFLRRLAQVSELVGCLATNSVGQGDTREVGLDWIVAMEGWTIFRAMRSEPWPNEATIEIAKVWMTKSRWTGNRFLDGSRVDIVGSSLTAGAASGREPYRLLAQSDQAFLGCALSHMGFVVDDSTAKRLLASNDRNREVVRPYLNGQDLNEQPDHRATRWVIDFRDWTLEKAMTYPEPFAVVDRLVRPDVLAKKGYPGWAKRWWQFWNVRPGLRKAVQGLDRMIAIAQVSKTLMPLLVPSDQVPSHKVIVFAYDDAGHLGVLSSALHWWWAIRYTATMRVDPSYSPSDVFATFPLPELSIADEVATVATALVSHRADLMRQSQLGLTKTYNRVHNPAENGPDVVRLRDLHVELDYAVCAAYGWGDLPLDHHHWETPQGMRFTVSPAAKDELLDRLLELNHERYAAEVAAGLHEKKKAGGRGKKGSKGGAAQGSLL